MQCADMFFVLREDVVGERLNLVETSRLISLDGPVVKTRYVGGSNGGRNGRDGQASLHDAPLQQLCAATQSRRLGEIRFRQRRITLQTSRILGITNYVSNRHRDIQERS